MVTQGNKCLNAGKVHAVAVTLGALLNPNFPPVQDQLDEVQEVARATGLQIHVLRASIDREIDAAFDSIAQTAHCRTLGGHRSILRHPPRQAYRLGNAPRGAHDVSISRIRRGPAQGLYRPESAR